MANQVLNNPKTMEGFMRLMVDLVYEGFEKRRGTLPLMPPLPSPSLKGISHSAGERPL